MKNHEIEQFTDQYGDILQELGNIGAGNAATALAQLLDCRIAMSVPQVRLLDFENLDAVFGNPEEVMTGIYFRMSGDVQGSVLFLLPQAAAARLVNRLLCGMLGLPEKEAPTELSGEMECSAMMEVGNIIVGAYLNALSDMTGLKIASSAPQMAVDMAGALLGVPAVEFGQYADKLLLVQTRFSHERELEGAFLMLPELASYEKILQSLGVR